MINFIIAFDNENGTLGDYFNSCRCDILGFLDENPKLVNQAPFEIPSANCYRDYLSDNISKYSAPPFLFIAYSHGNRNALVCDTECYVMKDVNTSLFDKSVFYSNACFIGAELGDNLIQNGCLAFIGYKEEVPACLFEPYRTYSINCDNAGLKAFLSSNISIKEAFKIMCDVFTQYIDKLENVKDMLYASVLARSREALVVKGDLTIKKEHLYCRE